MKTFAVAVGLALALASASQALDVRFYPSGALRTYELDPGREVHGLLVHNVAVINDSDEPVTIAELRFELFREGRLRDMRTFGDRELAALAGVGSQLQETGLIASLPFAFGGQQLLPEGVTLSGSATLAPGEALLVNGEPLAFRGARDELRIHVASSGGEATASIPVTNERSKTHFSFPLRGLWYDGAGPSFHSHHRWMPMEQFAHDLIQFDERGESHSGDGSRLSDYYAYGEPVLAAAPGRVIAAVDAEADDDSALMQPGEEIEAFFARMNEATAARLARGGAVAIAGNHVVIDHGDSEYSVYVHLREGSVAVAVGDTVERGDQLGEVGSTGNSTEPHLHFQVCDAPDALMCSGIPPTWENLGFGDDPAPRDPQTGDLLSGLASEG